MVEKSAVWRNVAVGDGQAYTHTDWQGYWAALSTGVMHRYACVLPDSGNPGVIAGMVEPTAPASMGVRVNRCVAFLDGAYYSASADVELTLTSNNSGHPRKDLVVLRRDLTGQQARLQVIRGSPGTPAAPPSLQLTGSIKDYPLGEIELPSGATSVASGMITPMAVYLPNSTMDMSLVRNGTSQVIEPGRAVRIHPSSPNSVALAVLEQDVIGVSVGRIGAQDYGVICRSGVVLGYFDAAVALGAHVVLGANGEMSAAANPQMSLGRVFSPLSGAGFSRFMLDKFKLSDYFGETQWQRPGGDFPEGRIYHTTISPPATATFIVIEPIVTANRPRIPAFELLYSTWAGLSEAQADNELMNADQRYFVMPTGFQTAARRSSGAGSLSVSPYFFVVGRTSAGALAVGHGLTGDSISINSPGGQDTTRRILPVPSGIKVGYR